MMRRCIRRLMRRGGRSETTVDAIFSKNKTKFDREFVNL